MTSNSAASINGKENSLQAQTPAAELSTLLAGDMDNVNAFIISEMQSDVALIPKLAGYLIAAGGKRVRPLLTLASASLFSKNIESSYGLAAAVEFIHTATLLHDDVVDGSEERRGQKAANLIFGNDTSVLVGDFLFSRAFQLMVKSGSIDVLRILSNASAVIAEGEVLQLQTQGDLSTNAQTYYKVIAAKTAELFAAACEIGPVIAGKQEHAAAMRSYGYNLGMAFQIADDVLDYQGNSKDLGKNTGDDFHDHKVTLPVILAFEEGTEDEKEFWRRCFEKEDIHKGDLEHAYDLIQKYDTCSKALQIARNFSSEAKEALSTIETDTSILKTLENLPDYLVSRSS